MKSETGQLEAGPILRLARASVRSSRGHQKVATALAFLVHVLAMPGRFGIRTACALWSYERAGPGTKMDQMRWNCAAFCGLNAWASGEYNNASILPIQDCIPGLTRQDVSWSVFSEHSQSNVRCLEGQKADSLLCAGHDGIFLIGSQAMAHDGTRSFKT